MSLTIPLIDQRDPSTEPSPDRLTQGRYVPGPIFESISSYLDERDLSALGTTCKELEKRVTCLPAPGCQTPWLIAFRNLLHSDQTGKVLPKEIKQIYACLQNQWEAALPILMKSLGNQDRNLIKRVNSEIECLTYNFWNLWENHFLYAHPEPPNLSKEIRYLRNVCQHGMHRLSRKLPDKAEKVRDLEGKIFHRVVNSPEYLMRLCKLISFALTQHKEIIATRVGELDREVSNYLPPVAKAIILFLGVVAVLGAIIALAPFGGSLLFLIPLFVGTATLVIAGYKFRNEEIEARRLEILRRFDLQKLAEIVDKLLKPAEKLLEPAEKEYPDRLRTQLWLDAMMRDRSSVRESFDRAIRFYWTQLGQFLLPPVLTVPVLDQLAPPLAEAPAAPPPAPVDLEQVD